MPLRIGKLYRYTDFFITLYADHENVKPVFYLESGENFFVLDKKEKQGFFTDYKVLTAGGIMGWNHFQDEDAYILEE